MAIKKYEGVLERLGTGEYAQRGTASRYDVVVIGGQDIRNVATGGYVNSFLDVGKNITLYVGPLFLMKYIYAVKTDNGLKKMSIAWLIGNAFVKLLLAPIIFMFASLFGALGPLIGTALVGYLAYRSVRAFIAYNSIK